MMNSGIGEVDAFLSNFSYVDWEIGDDDRLRVGDFVVLSFTNPYTLDETLVPGRIVLFDEFPVPCFLFNEVPDEEDSGEYGSIFSAYLDGAEFFRTTEEEYVKLLNEETSV